jgi:hypothetical protein
MSDLVIKNIAFKSGTGRVQEMANLQCKRDQTFSSVNESMVTESRKLDCTLEGLFPKRNRRRPSLALALGYDLFLPEHGS